MNKINLFRRYLLSGVALLTVITLISSCGGCNKEGEGSNVSAEEALINFASNEECQMIMSFRVGDLIKKSGLKDDLLPAEMKMMADTFLGQYLNSEETGIDLSSTAFVFGDFTGIPKAPKMVGVLVSITNAETFGAFVESQTRMSPEEGEGYSFIKLQGKGAIVWNQKFAALIAGDKLKDIDKKVASLLSKGKGNVKNVEAFAKKKSDMGFYMDMEKYMKIVPKDEMGPGAEMMDIKAMKDLMKDFYMYGTLNFENGKIVASYKMDMNSKMKDFMNKAYKNGNEKYASLLGGNNVIGFGAAFMDLNAVLGIYEEMGFFDIPSVAEAMAEMKAKSGVSIQDILNKFTGDFAISFVGMEQEASAGEHAKMVEDEYAGFYEDKPSMTPKIALAIGINDEEMNKIFDTIPTLKKLANGTYQFEKGGMCFKNGVLFATNDLVLLEDFSQDGTLTPYTKNNANKLISGNSVCGYFDFDALTKAMGDVNPEAAVALGALDYAEMTVNKNGEMNAVLYLKNKSQNSLKALGKMIIESSGAGAGRMF